uniref:Uncharacterized protein n=1 Tax=Arundo donax TaxID=35708 RepID=A0A0A9DRC4_ARUDO
MVPRPPRRTPSPPHLLSIKSNRPPCPDASPPHPPLLHCLTTPSAADPLLPLPFPCRVAPSSLPLIYPSNFLGPSTVATPDRPAPCCHLFGVPYPASLPPMACIDRLDLVLLDPPRCSLLLTRRAERQQPCLLEPRGSASWDVAAGDVDVAALWVKELWLFVCTASARYVGHWVLPCCSSRQQAR